MGTIGGFVGVATAFLATLGALVYSQITCPNDSVVRHYRDSCTVGGTSATDSTSTKHGTRDIDTSGWTILQESRAARFARDPTSGRLSVTDRRSYRQTVYEPVATTMQPNPRFRVYRYSVHCQPLPPYLTCTQWRSLVRFACSYVIAWLNTPDWSGSDGTTFPIIRLEDEDDDNDDYDDDDDSQIAKTTFAFRSFRDPLGLGAANVGRVWLNLHANFQFSELRDQLFELTRRVGLIGEFDELIAREPRRCEHSFTTTLLHEVMHVFSIGHAVGDVREAALSSSSSMSSLMYPVSYGYEARPQPNAQLGGYPISTNDVYRLRDQWGRTTVFLAEEMYGSGAFLREFVRAFAPQANATTARREPTTIVGSGSGESADPINGVVQTDDDIVIADKPTTLFSPLRPTTPSSPSTLSSSPPPPATVVATTPINHTTNSAITRRMFAPPRSTIRTPTAVNEADGATATTTTATTVGSPVTSAATIASVPIDTSSTTTTTPVHDPTAPVGRLFVSELSIAKLSLAIQQRLYANRLLTDRDHAKPPTMLAVDDWKDRRGNIEQLFNAIAGLFVDNDR